MKLETTVQQTFPIVETFHSVQGEGAWTGTSAFFIRLALCDVGCWFCDTKESWSAKRHPQRSIDQLVQGSIAANSAIVVITGGEPLMHDLTELTKALHRAELQLHLETSGAHPFSGEFDWVTLSPKLTKPPHESVYPRASELKIVIAQAEDFEWAEQQSKQVGDRVLRYLQPEWSRQESLDLVFEYVKQHPEWRLSLQTHKLLGVR